MKEEEFELKDCDLSSSVWCGVSKNRTGDLTSGGVVLELGDKGP